MNDFLEWLFANYTEEEALTELSRIRKEYALGRKPLETNQVYLYWQQYVQPQGAQPDQQGAPVPAFPYGDDKAIDSLLRGQGSLDDLENLLMGWLGNGKITQEEVQTLFDKYSLIIDPYTTLGLSDEVKAELSTYNSRDDLATRIFSLPGIDKATASEIYNAILAGSTPEDLAIRKAQGGIAAEQFKQEQRLKQERSQYQQELAPALNYISNSPYTTQRDLTNLRENVNNPDVVNSILTSIAGRQQGAERRGAAEDQAGRAFIAGLNKPVAPQTDRTPPLPAPVSGTGYGEGTRLRSFIEGEVSKTAQDTQQARMDWWKRINPSGGAGKTFEGERDRITAEMNKWQQIAGSAPSTYGAGGIYNEGGLAGIAQGAYERSKANLAKLSPEQFGDQEPEPVGPQEEDPFLTALKKRNFRAEYFRQPGTGISSRYAPSVRY